MKGRPILYVFCLVENHKVLIPNSRLYRFGINAEYIFGAINGYGYILADFFCKSSRQLASGIELSATGQVGQILLTLIVQTMKKKILAFSTLFYYTESLMYIRNLWLSTHDF